MVANLNQIISAIDLQVIGAGEDNDSLQNRNERRRATDSSSRSSFCHAWPQPQTAKRV